MRNTPWGISEYEQKLAEGIISYSTDCHGGIWLSPERQKEIGYSKNWLNTPEWWEEDHDWAVPFAFFCKEIWMHTKWKTFDNILNQAVRIVETDHPDMLAVIQKKIKAYRTHKKLIDIKSEHRSGNVYLLPGSKTNVTGTGGTA